jgi:hypothetical protein
LYCQTASCQYSRIGFGKRSALNTHTRKHHGQSNTLLIPAKIRRTTDAEAEAGAKEHDLQVIDVEAQQLNLQQQLRVQTTQPQQGALSPQSVEESGQVPSSPAAQPVSQQKPQPQLPSQISLDLIRARDIFLANPQIVEVMDKMFLPPKVLGFKILQDMTPDVKTWAQLKVWVHQNPTLVPGLDVRKLILLQVLHHEEIVGRQQRVSEMNDQGFDANVSAKHLIETRSPDPEKAYEQAQGSEWADEANFLSHGRAPSKEYLDISSPHEAPSIQPQDGLENRSYHLSWPEDSQDTYDSLDTPINGLREDHSSSSWFDPPADVQPFQDRNPQLDHFNMAGNKAQLSRENNTMTRTMAPASDHSTLDFHEHVSGHPAQVQTLQPQVPGNDGVSARMQQEFPIDTETDPIAPRHGMFGKEHLTSGSFQLSPSPIQTGRREDFFLLSTSYRPSDNWKRFVG